MMEFEDSTVVYLPDWRDYEPDWMKYDPSAPRRTELGDGWVLHAAYVLDAMQPYPGDSWSVIDDGIQPRFTLIQHDMNEYIVYDKIRDFGTSLPRKLIDKSRFQIAEWYACQLSHQERCWCNFTETIPIGDAREMNASIVL
jgi:hypothetical protein